MAYVHLGEMLLERARRSPEGIAFRVRQGPPPPTEEASYGDVVWRDVLPRLEHVAAGLLSIPNGLANASAITIVGNTSLDWIVCDFAGQLLGLRTVPIYASLQPEEVGYCHVDLAAEVAICENAEQVAKVRTMRAGFRFFDKDYGPESVKVRHIVVIDPTGLEPAGDWESLATLEARGRDRRPSLDREMESRRAQIRREDVATYTYTSGTTGPPKAVIQTHDNMLSMLESIDRVGLFHADLRVGGLFLFLPLAHSFGRLIELSGPFFASPVVLSTVPTLGDDLRLARPGFFPGAPRVFEKMKARIDGAVADAPALRQRLFRWAMGVGAAVASYRARGAAVPRLLRLRHRLADRLVLSKLRARMGLERCELILSGSAPLPSDVHRFFLALGFTMIEGYGLTETCPALTAGRPGLIEVGTVGVALDGVEVRIADDGEILARGANISKGYHNRPDADRDAFSDDGWFRTGDLGSLDERGFLRITGRKKELIKTSGGKYVAPVKIESMVKAGLPFVQEVVLVGDRRNYCVALISLDPEGLATWARQHDIPADPGHPTVEAALSARVTQVNEKLASFETVKAFRVLPGPLTVEGGALTASLKVKRKVVEERYADLISQMYTGD
jgi:long-chain acyl-CoA synthetase